MRGGTTWMLRRGLLGLATGAVLAVTVGFAIAGGAQREAIAMAEAAGIHGGCGTEPNRECIRGTTCDEYAVNNSVQCPESYDPGEGVTVCAKRNCVIGCSLDSQEQGEGTCGTAPYVEDCYDFCGPQPSIACGTKIMGKCDYTYNSTNHKCEKTSGCNFSGSGASCPQMPVGCEQQ